MRVYKTKNKKTLVHAFAKCAGNQSGSKANWLIPFRQVMERWIKEYGKVFGYFIGEMPYLMITDTEMVKQCFVKEANIFHDRPQFAVDVEPFASSLLALRGE